MAQDNRHLLETVEFSVMNTKSSEIEQVLSVVLKAMDEKGYDPLVQIVGYITSGEPTYITNYNNARTLISRLERYTILEEIVDFYLKNNENLRQLSENNEE